MKASSQIISVIFAIVVLFSSQANAVVVTIEMALTDDRTFRDSNTDGAADSMHAQDDNILRTFGNAFTWRSAVEFDISAITAGATVTNATLSLRDAGLSRSGRIDVFGYDADGVITLSDGINTTFLAGSLLITEANGVENFNIDVTSLLLDLFAASADFAGFLLVSESSNFNIGGSELCSSEGGNGGLAECLGGGPRLSVSFENNVAAIPVPAALPFYAFGLMIGVGSIKRKKRTISV